MRGHNICFNAELRKIISITKYSLLPRALETVYLPGDTPLWSAEHDKMHHSPLEQAAIVKKCPWRTKLLFHVNNSILFYPNLGRLAGHHR